MANRKPGARRALKRADMPSLALLLDMYDAGTEYVALENEPEDAPERDAMVAILDLIEDLIPVEANEDTANRARRLHRSQSEGELRYAVAPITHVDVRDPSATDDNTWTMSGYAAVFNQETTLYDSKFIRLTESIDPKFFNRTLREQPLAGPEGVVHFNFGHDMNRAVAATDVPAGQPGSLQLSSDKTGLRFLAKVPRDDPDGIAMAVKMRSGVVRQASFAFTIGAAEYTTLEQDDGPDTEHRTLLDCKHLYDVCATAQGAYPQTVSGLRSYAAALGQPTFEPQFVIPTVTAGTTTTAVYVGGQHRQPASGGESTVNPTRGGRADRPTAETLAEAAQAVNLARTRFGLRKD